MFVISLAHPSVPSCTTCSRSLVGRSGDYKAFFLELDPIHLDLWIFSKEQMSRQSLKYGHQSRARAPVPSSLTPCCQALL